MLKCAWKNVLCALCVMQAAAVVAFDVPDWAAMLMMIAPVVLLADAIVTWKKGGRKQ